MSKNKNQRVYAQGRFRVETLAMIADWLDRRGSPADTRSDLLFRITESFAAILEANEVAVRPQSFTEAEAILRRLGLLWEHGSKGFDQIVAGLAAESLVEVQREESQISLDAESTLEAIRHELAKRGKL